MQETSVQSLGWEDPLEEAWLPTPVFLPEESHGQRSLVGYSPWGRKELDTTERLTLYFFIAWSNGFFCIPAFQVKGAHSRRL